MDDLEYVNISHNPKLSILAVASLCSCPNLQQLVMHGIELSAIEQLFLYIKTFENIANGELKLEMGDEYTLRVVA